MKIVPSRFKNHISTKPKLSILIGIIFVLGFGLVGYNTFLRGRAAPIVTSIKTGNWSDPSVWNTGQVPRSGELVVISAGNAVVYNLQTAKLAGVTVSLGATLEFDPNNDTVLETTQNVIVNGTLRMRPSSSTVSQVLRFVDINESAFVGGGMVPLTSDVGLWVMEAGQLDIQGSKKTGWTRLLGGVNQGVSSITLKDLPVGWKVGDNITIAPTESPVVGAASYTGFDEAKITSISANNVVLDSPVTRDHPKVNNNWTAEVMNLTRNAQIEGTPTGRSHIFIRSSKPQVVDYLGIRYMGPRPPTVSTTRPLGAEPKWPSPMEIFGRYGLHFHHSLDGSRGSTVTGTVVRDTGNHAFVPHLSHGITFKDTISYNTIYDAYWWDGVRLPKGCAPEDFRTCQLSADPTHDTIFENCIASKVTAIGNSIRLSAFELGNGDRNVIKGCVAVGVANGADSSGFDWPEGAGSVWGFTGNIAHNNVTSGIFGWQNTTKEHIIDNFDAYYNTNGIEQGAYTNHYLFRGGTLYGNKNTGVQLHAVSDGGAIPLAFENMTIDSGGIGNSLVQTVNHNAATYVSTLFKNINFKAHNIMIHQDNAGRNPDVVDIVDSQLSGITVKNIRTPSNSLIRVQSGGSAFAILPPGHIAAGRAVFIPEWNSYKLNIRPFFGVEIPSEDLTAPSIAVKVFDANQEVSGLYTFRATITDNIAVTKAEFYIDNILLATKTVAPYDFPWDTTKLADGQHQGMMKAYDAAGNIGTNQFPFRTANGVDIPPPPADTTLPIVSLTAPANGATVAGTINVNATASDNVAVTKVEFLVDGALKGTDTTSPYSYSLNTTTLTNGSHSISAKAYDAAGNTKTATITVTVSNVVVPPPDTTPPSISFTSPANGATVSGTINLAATASDNVAVTKVEFIVDGFVKGTDTTNPYSVSFDTTTIGNGSHTISAKAYDAANNSTITSRTVTVANTAAKVGDINGDGGVDIFDLSILLSKWQKAVPVGDKADLNKDGKIDIFDLSILLSRWGK